MEFKESSDRLIKFIGDATCSFTTVKTAEAMLKENGFTELKLGGIWKLKKGGNYYINVYDSSLMAFTVGKKYNGGMIRIVTAHTDSPSFSVKPHPEMRTGMGNIGKLNVEGYGGAILNTWLDRPLSIAMRVSVKSDNVFEPEVRIVDFRRPIVTIPNLAIHMNRDVNKGVELNKQVDMLPIFCQPGKDKEDFFMDYLASELNVKKEDILDYEGYVYNTEGGQYVGMNDEFILCPRLDNATSVVACLVGIIKSSSVKGKGTNAKNADSMNANSMNANGINAIMVFDNEEIGSMTKQGANSSVLTFILEKLYRTLSEGGENTQDVRKGYIDKVLNGMMISLDVAHATHPNHPEKNDPTNAIVMNAGPVIKRSAAQRYATDAKAVGIVEQICRKADIPYQKFSNRSDMVGGSTLGPISDIQLPMLTVDIGAPILAMHSAMETMGAKDQAYMEELVKGFFSF